MAYIIIYIESSEDYRHFDSAERWYVFGKKSGDASIAHLPYGS